MLMNQHSILNKGSLNRNIYKTRLCINWLMKILTRGSQELKPILALEAMFEYTNSVFVATLYNITTVKNENWLYFSALKRAENILLHTTYRIKQEERSFSTSDTLPTTFCTTDIDLYVQLHLCVLHVVSSLAVCPPCLLGWSSASSPLAELACWPRPCQNHPHAFHRVCLPSIHPQFSEPLLCGWPVQGLCMSCSRKQGYKGK